MTTNTTSLDGVYHVVLKTSNIKSDSFNVDNITLNDNKISSDTGTVSFDNDNITTTGSVSGSTVNATGLLTGTRADFIKAGSMTTGLQASSLPVITLSSQTTPLLVFDENDESQNNKIWDIRSTGGELWFNCWNDSFTGSVGSPLKLRRHGNQSRGVLIDNIATEGNVISSTTGDIKLEPTGSAKVRIETGDAESGVYIDSTKDTDSSGYGLKVATYSGAEVVILNDASINIAGNTVIQNNSYIRLTDEGSGIRFGTNIYPSNNEIRQQTDKLLVDGYSWVYLRERGSNVIRAGTGNNGIFFPQYVNGTLSINAGAVTTSSDRRLKQNENPLTYGLAEINQLQPKTFEWKRATGKTELGFIAQDVAQVLPEAVDGKKYPYQWQMDEDGNPKFDSDGNPVLRLNDDGNPIERMMGLNYNGIVATLVKAVQELATKNQQLEARLDAIGA